MAREGKKSRQGTGLSGSFSEVGGGCRKKNIGVSRIPGMRYTPVAHSRNALHPLMA